MLCITKTIGYQCAVYDSDDGTLEWVTKEDVLRSGFQFQKGELKLQKEQCNFGKNGENIFSNPYKITMLNGYYVMHSCGKKFKFRIENGFMHFTSGILVPVEGVRLC